MSKSELDASLAQEKGDEAEEGLIADEPSGVDDRAMGNEPLSRNDDRVQAPPVKEPDEAISVQPAQFSQLVAKEAHPFGAGIELLLDVVLNVSVELGRTTLPIKEVLALGPGSIIELDKMAGEAVDLLVNGRRIASGEVVVVDERFGVRITAIVSPPKRMESLT